MTTRYAKLLACTALLSLSLAITSCQTGGKSRAASNDPKVVQAKQALLESLGDMTVKNQWISAMKFRVISQQNVSSVLISNTVHYSGWQCGNDDVLRGHYSSLRKAEQVPANGKKDGKDERTEEEVAIPIRNVATLYIHDHEAGRELEENFLKVLNPNTHNGVGPEQRVYENVTHTATVEFALKKGATIFDRYKRIFFPNRQRAEQFVERWNALTAAMQN